MNNDVLNIRWNTGGMVICMNVFFPCSATKYNKLLKIIQMDTHAEEVIEKMKQFFQKRIPELDKDFQELGKFYWDFRQRETDFCTLVKTGRFPNGLPMTKEQIKEEKKICKELGVQKRNCERDAKKAKKQKEWFEQKVGELNG